MDIYLIFPVNLQISAAGFRKLLVKMDQLEEDEIQNISDRRVWNLHYYIRKFAHFVLYCGLGFLMVFSVISIKYRSYVSYIIAWLASSLYGVLDELHQNFVPGRGATIADMKLDAVSALAGVVLAAVLIEVWRVYMLRRNWDMVIDKRKL